MSHASTIGRLAATASAVALLGSALAAGAQSRPVDLSRGALLYDTHCIACHNAQMHWRDQRLVTDWASLRQQVHRWQAAAHLNWSSEDIDAVARYLNDSVYRVAAEGRVAALHAPPLPR